MGITALVLILLAAIAIHELAHAIAMRNEGVKIDAAGLGLPIQPMLRIPTRWGITLTLSPWLVGAYVSTTDADNRKIEQLPYKRQAWILNAGILANLTTAAACITVITALNGAWYKAALSAAVTAAIWHYRKGLAAYVVPFGAIPALGAVIYGLIDSWSQGQTGLGLAGIGVFAPQVAGTPITVLKELAIITAVLSLALAVMNMIPIYGLDNGRVVELAMRNRLPRWAIRAYEVAGVALIIMMLVGAIASDLWSLIKAVF